MPIKRREIRESAFLLIFEKLFRQDEELDDIFMSAMEVNEITVNDDVKKLVEGVCDKQEEIDGIIGKFSNKRTVERIPKINLAILRLAIYEAMYEESVPVNVAISEAVALAGKYALEPDVSFVNGVLGSFAKEQEGKTVSFVLGIDTSNYTTSCALLDTADMRVRSCKKLLPVKQGERGLRQSDAVFHHTKQLPELMKQLFDKKYDISAVGYSYAPRCAEGSYMPCFLVGENVAQAVSLACGADLEKTSHQVGHILAALYSCGKLDMLSSDKPFAAFHVSGGTTDLLLCEPDKAKLINITQIGGSRDLKGGQAIDRTGVRLGLSFPCGKELERLASESKHKIKPKASVDGLYCSLSGIENQCMKLIDESCSVADVAAYCIDCVCLAVEKMTVNLRHEYKDIPIIYAGGVMSNRFIKSKLEKYGSFAEPEFSSDNAVGVAVYAAIRKGKIKI